MSAQLEPLPPIRKGELRAFLECNCGMPGWYDFVPYSLSVPIISLKCGHDHRLARRIDEQQFFASCAAHLACVEQAA